MKQELADNLRRVRTEQGLSVQALARKSGIARATLIALEAGDANPTLETLMSIGEALSVPATLLLANESPDVQLVRADEAEVLEEDFGTVRILDQMASITSLGVLEGRFNEGEEFARAARGDQPGSYAFLFVLFGRMQAGPVSAPVEVNTGDYLRFPIDKPYVLRAIDGTARFFSGVCATRPGDLDAMIPRRRQRQSKAKPVAARSTDGGTAAKARVQRKARTRDGKPDPSV